MRTALSIALLLGSVAGASAQYGGYGYGSNSSSHYNSGYTNSHGTYVQPHYSTNPNNTQYDNYGTRGNYNPYSGQTGTRNPRW
ncbi:hypothetical protein [Methylobacterium symbioticum]|uniref:Uncharacterized protein n=1 Tax=Methylobacterium symbioticum TaxID=2584084 RepID=A0A509EEC3_9HYPH|nr:hypothetical protein [Methylobacterium symbioticum]VUD71789.1 hypothetical protein MET9862_02377 [Methylobacterium symbioticum]